MNSKTLCRVCSAIALFFTIAFGGQPVLAAEYFVSPSGSDSNPGTLAAPYRTIQYGYNRAIAGDTVYVRGGTYAPSTQVLLNRSGSSGKLIKLFAYGNEIPVIDGINMSTDGWTKGAPLLVTRNYNHVTGFEIKNGPDFGAVMSLSASYNIFERLNVHHNGRLSQWEGKGIGVFDSAAHNLILNCDSHHNRDLQLGNADGYQIASAGTGNVLRGNRAWRNSDDGFDFWASAPVQAENNWAWENGYDDNLKRLGDGNGFKLGGNHAGKPSGGHTVRNNVSWRNPLHGFDYNWATLAMTLYNNTGWHNGPLNPGGESKGCNFNFYVAPHTIENNISFDGCIHTSGTVHNNSWDQAVSVTSADFVTMDETGARGPRQPDGSLPAANFMHLVGGSDLIDKGSNVGLPYRGSAPDLGAFEFGMAAPPPPAPSSSSATFVKLDTATRGSWSGVYGADGYIVSQNSNTKIPNYAQVSFSGALNYIWNNSPIDTRALQRPENKSSRISATWYANTYSISAKLTDGNPHQVALYLLDWDSSARAETITVTDAATGAVLDTRAFPVGSFHNGQYAVWTVKGNVKFQVTRTGGANAVVSGIFFR